MRHAPKLLALLVAALPAACDSHSSLQSARTVAVELLAPVGGEAWSGVRQITWQTTGRAATVEIRLSHDGGSTFDEILARNVEDAGSWEWSSVTDYAFAGQTDTQYRFRLVDTQDPYCFAFSENFTIPSAQPARHGP